MNTMNKRRKYDEEFKKDAVRLLINSGRTVKAVAEELGVIAGNLARWRMEHLEKLDGRSEDTGVTVADLEKENRRLRKELTYAEEQRDILKKACGILSDKPERGMP
jgi:transposase